MPASRLLRRHETVPAGTRLRVFDSVKLRKMRGGQIVGGDVRDRAHAGQQPDAVREPRSRAERRELQALLTRSGYDVGDSDGVIGTKTKEAIADFQSRAGLQRNGRASLKVLNALRGR